MTNKTLTSAVLNTGVSGTAILDEDDMTSDSATQLATQQSIKAYVDSGTVTMTNKTLTSPKFADGGFIADVNGNEMLVFQTTTDAVNSLELTNSATGNSVVIGAMGEDANIDINITPKGTGNLVVTGSLIQNIDAPITANNSDGQLTIANLLTQIINATGTSGDRSYQLPNASDVVGELTNVGDSIDFHVIANSLDTVTLTSTTTFGNMAVSANTSGKFRIRVTAVGSPAYTVYSCLLYTSPSPRDRQKSRMPSSA